MDVTLPSTDSGPDLAELPAASPFEGYEAELASLEAHWRSGVPVVTIAGEGGVGKTGLAVEAARRFRDHFPGGILGLSLDPIPDLPALLSRLVGWVWGAVPDPRWDERRLLNEAAYRLREQERLLVLDGYEEVARAADTDEDVAAAANTVRRFARRLLGGRTRLLLTGREPIGALGEETVRLDGLDPGAGAVLFRALASDGRGDAEGGAPADQEALGDLSQEVGGSPLALRLLAGAYSAKQEEWETFRQRLTGQLRAARLEHPDQPHHAALVACLGVALDGLATGPRALLPRLTLFQAPFLAGLAAAVFDEEAVPDHLHTLAQAGLVDTLDVAAMGEQATLYRLHPAVRALVDPGMDPAALEASRLRFVAAYTFFTSTALQRFTALGSRLVRIFIPDLIQALAWAERDDWSGLAFNLAGLWRHFGLLDEALRFYWDVLAIYETQGDQQGMAATLAMMGQLLAQREEHRDALQALLVSLSTFVQAQAMDDVVKVARAITGLRRRVGPAQFQVLWAEVAGDEPLPDWLIDDEL